MVSNIGSFLILGVLALALMQLFAPMIYRNAPLNALKMQIGAGFMQLALCATAFFLLFYGFVHTDLSLKIVANHSSTLQPMIYKFAAMWGNHEGSMLLWQSVLALYGGYFAIQCTNLKPALSVHTFSYFGLVCAGFALYLLWLSNPFESLFPPPVEGAGLNPMLQDKGLTFHPPVLYMGYVGLALPFAFACAALSSGVFGRFEAGQLRKYLAIPFGFLTVGIGAGGWWAYRELGWGGWWFWDPVENISLLPWLISCALYHSLIITERRGTLKSWVIILSMAGFLTSIAGTFVVRSGLISSVHAFASDPERGYFILSFFALLGFVAFGLYARRAYIISANSVDGGGLLSRQGVMLLANICLLVMFSVVVTGTFLPLAVELMGASSIAVGIDYYNAAFIPLSVLMALMCIAALRMRWGQESARSLFKIFILDYAYILISIVAAIALYKLSVKALALCVAAIGGLLVFRALQDGFRYIPILNQELVYGGALLRLATFGRAACAAPERNYKSSGRILSHSGFGVLLIGVAINSAFKHEDSFIMKKGDTVEFSGYKITYEDNLQAVLSNYATFTVRLSADKQGQIHEMLPEKRFYPAGQNTSSEVYRIIKPTHDIYSVIGEVNDKAEINLRLYYEPLIHLIFIGFLMIGAGVFSTVRVQK